MGEITVNGVSLERRDWDVVAAEGARLGLGRSATLRKIIREWAEAFRVNRQSPAADLSADTDKEL